MIFPSENRCSASPGVSHASDFISCPSTRPSTGLSNFEHTPRKKCVSNRFGIIFGVIHLAYRTKLSSAVGPLFSSKNRENGISPLTACGTTRFGFSESAPPTSAGRRCNRTSSYNSRNAALLISPSSLFSTCPPGKNMGIQKLRAISSHPLNEQHLVLIPWRRSNQNDATISTRTHKGGGGPCCFSRHGGSPLWFGGCRHVEGLCSVERWELRP